MLTIFELVFQGIPRCAAHQPGMHSFFQWGAAPWDSHHKECSVRMQQEHFGKYSVLEQGKSVADRQALTSLTAQSLSRLLIPPDINSRPCFTVTSICRERRRLQKLSAISDFSLFLSKLSLSWPLLCVCRSPFTLFLTFSATFPLSLSLFRSLSSLPPSTFCDPFLRLSWDFLLSPLQPYSLSSLHLKFICKHGPVQTGCASWPALVHHTLGFYLTFRSFRKGPIYEERCATFSGLSALLPFMLLQPRTFHMEALGSKQEAAQLSLGVHAVVANGLSHSSPTI